MNRVSKLLKANETLILLFHGVIPKKDYDIRNYTHKHAYVDEFILILQDLLKYGNPISINELYLHVTEKNKVPPNNFVLTFDDGFWNNYSYAAPILDDFRIPATFFVTTDFINYNKQSWIDKIESAISQTEQLSINSIFIPKELTKIRSTEEKKQLLKYFRENLKYRNELDLEVLADEIVFLALGNNPVKKIEVLDRKMNWNELKELSRNSLFTIGGHGKTHKILGFLSNEESSIEINKSIHDLRDFANIAVEHYSYPEGFEGSFTIENSSQLSTLGVKSAMTTIKGTVNMNTNLFMLNRHLIY